MALFIEWAGNFLEANIGAIVGAAIAALFGLYLKIKHLTATDVLVYLARLVIAPVLRVFRGKLILVYSDAGSDDDDTEGGDNSVAETIALALKRAPNLASRQVKTVGNADWLLRWPLLPWLVDGVLVLVCDVTRLSNHSERRDKIQRRLINYVGKGGLLITGHDIPYRRLKNSRLQSVIGFQSTQFARVAKDHSIEYTSHYGNRKTSNTALLDALPESLELLDKEVVRGTPSDDVEFLYTWANKPDDVWPDEPEIPLMTRRTHVRGVVYWINSGDQDENGPPRPLSAPNPDLINILVLMLKHR